MLNKRGAETFFFFFLWDWKVPDLTSFSVGHHCLFRQVLGSVAMHD